MQHLDPTRIHIDSPCAPIWEREPESFQDVMAQQLDHAPWFVLSLAAHALLVLLLFLLLPGARQPAPRAAVAVLLPAEQPIETPPPPPPTPPVHTPQPIEDPTLADPDLLDPTDDPTLEPTTEMPSQAPAAFDHNQWSTPVGVGGGPGGPYGQRGPGGGRGRGAPSGHIRDGLAWLARHQDDDGKWDCDGFMKHDTDGVPCTGPGNAVHDVGATGLALLAFLGDGNTMRSGPYREQVRRGVRWLRSQQQDNGLFGSNASNDFVYGHAIAAYAMCEAYGLSGYATLKDNAQRGLNYLDYHRNPYSVWRYQPRDNDCDTSVTGWCVMACASGRHFGLQVNDNALQLAAVWLDEATDADGRTGYTRAGEPSSRHRGDHMTRFPPDKGEAMTAVAQFCRYFLGQDPKDHPNMAKATALLAASPPVWDDRSGAIDHYYWYYATYAMYQHGGPAWTAWEKRLKTAVVDTQREDGNAKGSWDPIGVWGGDGGRVYSTAILTLTLEAYYRYTRLLR